MNSLLIQLREFDALRDQIEEHPDSVELRSISCQKPTIDKKNTINRLHVEIQDLIRKQGINSLYEHQAQAIELALQRKDVVLESPTASGKTLSFIVPMLETLLQDNNSHALMIYPMKALSNDQRRQLNDFSIEHIDSWIFDGDTDQEYRKLLKATPPRILITNPDSLHFSFLGWAHQWNNFLHKIKFIVVDEIHEYRGYFGTNFALLLRRFLLKLSKQGAYPQLFLSTATCANPLEHAERLTGRSFSLVSARNKMHPTRELAFIIPKIPDFNFIDIFQLRIARAALACLAKELSTIIFCPTRKFTEEAYKRACRDAEKYGLDPKVIASYRGGYKAEERREIEDGLRSGKYKIVFATNALELGIDIGKLDAVILAGFPDNVMSAWQRIGRAGRSWDKTSYVLFYASNNAVDEFYGGNIDAFLKKPLDEITIGISNEELIDRHMPFMLHESEWALTEGDEKILGETFYNKAKEKINQSKPIRGLKTLGYNKLSIRGGSGSKYTLIHNRVDVGDMSDVQVFREAYIGAIYNHFGKSYKVSSHGNKEIFLESCESHLSSKPSFYTTVEITDIFDGKRYKEKISIFYGKLIIYENFAGYQLIDERSGQIIENERSEATRRRICHSFWLGIDDNDAIKEGVSGLEHIFRIGAIFILPTDRYDTSTFSKTTAENEIYFYENYSGGIGIAEKAFSVWRNVIEEGIEIAKKCACKNGCPRCIYPPRLKDPSTVKKDAGIKLGKYLLKLTKDMPEERFDQSTHGWRLIER